MPSIPSRKVLAPADEAARLIAERDFAPLERLAASLELPALVEAWRALPSLGRLALFKLLEPPRAMELFYRLGYDEKYFLFCGLPMSSVAPLLEGLPPQEKRRFVSLPRSCQGDMMRDLLCAVPARASA